MIAFVQGTLRLIRKESVVLDVQGVGYEVYVSHPESMKFGQDYFLYTYQHVREDAILLFGFEKEEDYEVFVRLINVKGVGPKSAMNIMGAISGAEMIAAIENDDIKRLKALPGIGAKTAGQIVLDLKGKFVAVDTKEAKIENPVWDETQEALVSLGYKVNQLTSIKKELISNKELTTPQMIQQALRLLAK
ncbi:MAG: Holliday junction branch migration protein RuvA [Erysipelotrichaceae bacterium]|nr:Holliday junction branch migration protein RuvA [Erysipelotrichaceae bacterium]